MENNLNKEQLQGILGMLEAKKHFLASLENNLKAINEIIPLVASCAKDYDVQIEQVKGLLEPTVKVTEKQEESSKN